MSQLSPPVDGAVPATPRATELSQVMILSRLSVEKEVLLDTLLVDLENDGGATRKRRSRYSCQRSADFRADIPNFCAQLNSSSRMAPRS